MAALLPDNDLDHVMSKTHGLWSQLRNQSVFMTGSTGFVGTWMLASALRANDEFGLGLTIVALTRNPEEFLLRAPELAGHRAVHLLEGSLTDFRRPSGDFRYVVHAAVARPVDPGAAQPLGAFDQNVEGTRRVLEFASHQATRRFLFTSSGAVYGVQPPALTHVPEDYPGAPLPLQPDSIYGQAKRTSEFMCGMYGRAHGFDALIARLFAFVGPLLPLDANFAVGNFIRDALAGRPIRVAGDGTPYRSYLYSADLAVWLWTILLQGKALHPYNVGSSRALTIAELAAKVNAATGTRTTVEFMNKRLAGVPPTRYVPDVTRAEMELGLRDQIGIEAGIRRTVNWIQSRESPRN